MLTYKRLILLCALLLTSGGCGSTYQIVSEDIDGNKTTMHFNDFGSYYFSRIADSTNPAMNLDPSKLSMMQFALPGMKPDSINDFLGFKVYVSKRNYGTSYCYASYNPNNTGSIRELFSKWNGVVQPAYTIRNHGAELSMDTEATRKIINTLKSAGLNLKDQDSSSTYHAILSQKISKSRSQSEQASHGLSVITKPDPINYLSLYDNEFLTGIMSALNSVSYVVMPNSELPYTAAIYKWRQQKAYNETPVTSTHRITIVPTEVFANMHQGNTPYKRFGIYRESLLTIGCTDNSIDSLKPLLEGFRKELNLGGLQKSRSIGE